MGSSFFNSGDAQPRGHGPPRGSGRAEDLNSLAVPISHEELRRWIILDQLPLALDLLPSRGHPFGMFLTGAAAISILVGLFLGLGAEHPSWTSQSLHAFTLDGPGNVASWFSTLVLTASGLCCIIVWWLEGLAEDEDLAPSKAWLLGALLCFVMGLDESVGLHSLLTGFLAAHADHWGRVPPQFVWMLLYGLALLAFGIRAVFAMASRRSILAILPLIGAAGAYLLSAAVQAVPQFPLPLFPNRELWEEVPELAGHWLLLMALTCHAQRLLRGLLQDDRGSDSDPDADARLNTFRELLWRRNEESPKTAGTSDPRGLPDDVDAALERGDFLIIHPPHGRNRSRAVKRVIRRRTAAAGRTKRSDLDPPVIVAPVIPTTPSFGNPVAPSTVPTPTNSGGLNAFLAGMAYAETHRATTPLPNPPPGFQPAPQTAAWANSTGDAGTYGWNSEPNAGTPSSGNGGVHGFRPMGPAPGFQSPGVPSPAQNSDPRFGNVYPASVPRSGDAESAPSPGANTGFQANRFRASESGSSIPQGSGIGNPTLADSGHAGSGNSDLSAAAGVSRKLTKEEKKRLREMYERRLAQQQSAGG